MRIENVSIIITGIISLALSLYTFAKRKSKAASRLYSTSTFSSELDLDAIATLFISIINSTFNISSSAVVLLDTDEKKIIYEQSQQVKIPDIHQLKKLAKYFYSSNSDKTLILQDELFLIGEDSSNKISNQKMEVLEIMKKHNIQIVIPMTKEAKYSGLFLFGESSDKKIPKGKETSLLKSIIDNTSIAIGRALLYKEVESFNETLQQKIDKATESLQSKNKELQKLYDDLEALYQKEKNLMDMAGHEIRTPASVIKTNLHMLQDYLKKESPKAIDSKVKTYLQRLIDSIERQIQIINSFLETTRIDNEYFVLQIDTHDFVDIVSEAIKDVTPLANEKGLSIEFDKPKNKVHAEVDKVRIREVIDNLLNNAIKYTNKGYIEIEIISDQSSLKMSVRDTGGGIDKKDQDELFQKFSRIDPYTGGDQNSLVRTGGTGLGLYVSKNIIEAHKGKIGVKSEKGKGSIFYFEIPLYQSKTSS